MAGSSGNLSLPPGGVPQEEYEVDVSMCYGEQELVPIRDILETFRLNGMKLVNSEGWRVFQEQRNQIVELTTSLRSATTENHRLSLGLAQKNKEKDDQIKILRNKVVELESSLKNTDEELETLREGKRKYLEDAELRKKIKVEIDNNAKSLKDENRDLKLRIGQLTDGKANLEDEIALVREAWAIEKDELKSAIKLIATTLGFREVEDVIADDYLTELNIFIQDIRKTSSEEKTELEWRRSIMNSMCSMMNQPPQTPESRSTCRSPPQQVQSASTTTVSVNSRTSSSTPREVEMSTSKCSTGTAPAPSPSTPPMSAVPARSTMSTPEESGNKHDVKSPTVSTTTPMSSGSRSLETPVKSTAEATGLPKVAAVISTQSFKTPSSILQHNSSATIPQNSSAASTPKSQATTPPNPAPLKSPGAPNDPQLSSSTSTPAPAITKGTATASSFPSTNTSGVSSSSTAAAETVPRTNGSSTSTVPADTSVKQKSTSASVATSRPAAASAVASTGAGRSDTTVTTTKRPFTTSPTAPTGSTSVATKRPSTTSPTGISPTTAKRACTTSPVAPVGPTISAATQRTTITPRTGSSSVGLATPSGRPRPTSGNPAGPTRPSMTMPGATQSSSTSSPAISTGASKPTKPTNLPNPAPKVYPSKASTTSATGSSTALKNGTSASTSADNPSSSITAASRSTPVKAIPKPTVTPVKVVPKLTPLKNSPQSSPRPNLATPRELPGQPKTTPQKSHRPTDDRQQMDVDAPSEVSNLGFSLPPSTTITPTRVMPKTPPLVFVPVSSQEVSATPVPPPRAGPSIVMAPTSIITSQTLPRTSPPAGRRNNSKNSSYKIKTRFYETSENHEKVTSDDINFPFKCSCGERYQARASFTNHLNKMQNEWKFHCERCKYYFYFECDLKKHSCKISADEPRASSSNQSSSNSTPNRSSGSFVNDLIHGSDGNGLSSGNVTQRRRSHHGNNQRAAMKKLQDDIMKRKKHFQWNGTKRAHGVLYCNCGSQFKQQKTLTDHVQYFTRPWHFKCPVSGCNDKFYHFQKLKKHVASSHKRPDLLREFISGCELCGEKFKTRREFNYHKKQVHNIHPVKKMQARTGSSQSSQVAVETPGPSSAQSGSNEEVDDDVIIILSTETSKRPPIVIPSVDSPKRASNAGPAVGFKCFICEEQFSEFSEWTAHNRARTCKTRKEN